MGDIQTSSFSRNHSATIAAERGVSTNQFNLAAGGSSLSIMDAFADLFSQMGATALAPSPTSNEDGKSFADLNDDASNPATESSEKQDEAPAAESEPGNSSEPTPVLVSSDNVAVEEPLAKRSREEQTVESSNQETIRSEPDLTNRGKQQLDPQAKAPVDSNIGNSTVETAANGSATPSVTHLPANAPQPNDPSGEEATQQKSTVAEKLDTKPALRDPKTQPSEMEDATVPKVEEESFHSDEGDQNHRESRRERRDSRENSAGAKQSLAEKNTVGQERSAEQKAMKVAQSAASADASASVESSSQTMSATKPTIGHPATVDAAAAATRTAATAATASSTNTVRRAGITRATSPASPTPIPTNATNLGSDTAGKTTNSGDQPSTTDLISRAKLIQRVSKAFQHLGSNGGQIRIRLAPAELGTVRLEMQVSDRKMQTRVIAETEAAAAALREHLPELRMRLESQGIQMEKMSVEVESETHSNDQSGGESFAQDDPRNSNRSRDPRKADHRSASKATTSTYAPKSLPVTRPLVTSGVDVQL
ncbi:flagellar hook-length control protein [Novipirellula aureliae]|uniref:Flagellar hook-length control protein n=1 Tax=Novipirellula aureliae TaxID=2527966 RepID=A0A5C6EAA7_9BACT|nr:flagellar hook-length control protein FliK [Novipirellula aureliae]TWU45942.1 flagellar hook-length control protein [Novipirellula aureliae]